MKLIEDRGKTHGEWLEQSATAQWFKWEMQHTPNWEKLLWGEREALEFIATKISRILHGNPNHKDHWDDIAGYAALVSKEISDAGEGGFESTGSGDGELVDEIPQSKRTRKRRKTTTGKRVGKSKK